MAGINTNTSAMVALQTLKSVNKNLNAVQSEISTGLKVSNAKDNASVWAIAATMTSDVGGYKQLSDSLATGSAAIGVARTAAETVTGLLGQMKEKIVAAQSPSADRGKLQADVAELRNQITSVVSSAQFNGLNLVDGSNASINVLASLDRDATGTVTARNIVANGQNLVATAGGVSASLAGTAGVATGDGRASFAIAAGSTTPQDIVISAAAAGTVFSVQIDDQSFNYTVTAADAADTDAAGVVAGKIRAGIESMGIAGLQLDETASGTLSIQNAGTGNAARSLTITSNDAGTGGLAALAGIDVTSGAGATQALADIEGLITTAIDASAALGSSQKRVEIQQEFIGKLIDATKTGIGAMVDADLEEASARLQALQVQQQLGTQALSIANQAPQSILSLFR